MDKKRGIKNIFIGSVMGAALTTILIGLAIIDPTPNDVIYFTGIAAIVLISSLFIQKTILKEYHLLIFLSAIGLSLLALYFSFGLQEREWERFFYLAAATLILFILNLMIFLIRSRLVKKAEQAAKQVIPKTSLLHPLILLAFVFIVPIFLTVFLTTFMPPLIEPSGSVRYDEIWQGRGESKTGLLLSSWARTRGNTDDFHWVTSAYLVSREWTTNPDEPWESGSYVRRAKFYNQRVESFDQNRPDDFEGDTYDSEFFLPYSVIEEGTDQGDFPNYRPAALGSIIERSDRIQFGVETISVVSKNKDKFAREGVYGKVRKDIFLLDEYAGRGYVDDKYPSSRWLAMINGERTFQPGIGQPVHIKEPIGDLTDYSTETSPIKLETGALSWDTEKGFAVFEEKEVEIKPGILFSRSTALIRNDRQNEQLRHRGLKVLKFTNTTNSLQQLKFTDEIPKTFAQHVDQLQFKVSMGDSDMNISDNLDYTDGFVGISEYVNSGQVEVIEEDPVLVWVLGVAVGVTLYVSEYNPDLVGVQPTMGVAKWDAMSEEQVQKWIDARLNKYCDKIRQSAKANNIPPRLLATIVLNELADYDIKDQIEEIVNIGPNFSTGWAQLQPNRLRRHGVIDIGPRDQVRDPNVDIVFEESRNRAPVYPRGTNITYTEEMHGDIKIWERLNNPESAIELAAREIVYLLKMLEKGSPYTKNPWARQLLKDAEEGIDLNNIYANLKIDKLQEDVQLDAREKQIELEKTLAILVASGYNGQGNIYMRTNENEIFHNNKDPWSPGPKYVNEKWRPLYQPRAHGVNAAQELTKRLFESSCLKESIPEEFPPPPPPVVEIPPPVLVNPQYRDLVARDILVKPEEIGEGFVSHETLVNDNSASVVFDSWNSTDKGFKINVYLTKKINEAAHDRAKNDYVIMTRQKMSDSRYIVEKLPLSDFSYIVYSGRASFGAESYPGEIWTLKVSGSYYSFSGNIEEKAPLVKQAVINAISAMHHRVVELESR